MGNSCSDSAFALLGFEPRVLLDRAEIERAYLQRAGVLHPDIAQGDAEAAAKIADLNRARQTLLSDELRANAVLEALGGPSAEACRDLPDGFLMEIMEIREQAEEAAASKDDRLIHKLRAWADERRSHHLRTVTELLGAAGPGNDRLRSARVELNAWRYIERMLEQVTDKKLAF